MGRSNLTLLSRFQRIMSPKALPFLPHHFHLLRTKHHPNILLGYDNSCALTTLSPFTTPSPPSSLQAVSSPVFPSFFLHPSVSQAYRSHCLASVHTPYLSVESNVVHRPFPFHYAHLASLSPPKTTTIDQEATPSNNLATPFVAGYLTPHVWVQCQKVIRRQGRR